MKKLVTTLTALAMATGLSMTAQAATKVTTTTKSTTTQKTMPAKADKVTVKKTTTTQMKKDNHGTDVSKVAKKSDTAKKSTAKTNRATTKTGKKTGEVNIDIPADLKIDESNNKMVTPSANLGNMPAANDTVVVPVTKVTQTGPAVQSVTVQPVNKNTAITSTTTTVPVDVQTVPVAVNP